jgi:hypothetical protein
VICRLATEKYCAIFVQLISAQFLKPHSICDRRLELRSLPLLPDAMATFPDSMLFCAEVLCGKLCK